MTESFFSKCDFIFWYCSLICNILYETGPIQWMFSQHCGYWWPGALAVATVLTTHPCVSRCLKVKTCRQNGNFSQPGGYQISHKISYRKISQNPEGAISVVRVSNCSEIRGDCQILKGYKHDNSRSRAFETSRHLMIRRLMRYWIGPVYIYTARPS